eukprot:5077734-Prymnesium_polylepis.1
MAPPLVQAGVEAGDDAPPHLILNFEAKTRRRLELHYRTVHVCPSCYLYYMKRANELEPKHRSLIPKVASAGALGEIPLYASQDFRGG